jgi:hypothetical protein
VLAPLRKASGLAIGDLDQFSFHPAEYALLWADNVMIAGMNAVSVDAVACAILGTNPATVPVLRQAEKKGYGVCDLESIWVRGNEIEEARRALPRLY